MRGLVLTTLLLLPLVGCADGPDPVYEGPAGDGRLVYVPGVGITRQGAVHSGDEQALFNAARRAFESRQWDECIRQANILTGNFPEGARAVDAILLRMRANIEGGRADPDSSGFSHSVALTDWMFIYLAPDHDDRLKALLSGSAENRALVQQIRAMPVQEFIDRITPDARSIAGSRGLTAARQDAGILVTYYLPALELREYRRNAAELIRDVCWLAYASGNFNMTIRVADDLRALNPPPSVKGDTLFIEASALRRNGAYVLAADLFGFLFSGAGLRDTDTRWRPYALMWQIDQTLAVSKGDLYDLTYFERALELLGEYELYRFENPNIPASLHENFILLTEEVYGIMIRRHLNAADTYQRQGRRRARDYYLERAREWEILRDKRVADLRKDP